ncbi:6-phospho-beta-glucosidase [Streptomyces aidingensis]|uniref:6-phospho-beta-glucosidase n=1 Tax=Streptomyces aidingensis TaxID=910347 RepID=A0A1I1FNQ8_9ACTN|nr:6-phospho-beta-glucosidase [Streptomyces aidingensis]SFC00955.1 6-phospho-beta-glucosidase [Streptomyces aidingensis]
MRLSIIGGGGFRVPLVYRALLTDGGAEGGGPPFSRLFSDIVLYDADPARAEVIAAVLRGLRDTGGPGGPGGPGEGPAVRVAADQDEALRDADFVFCAIRVGGTRARARDERLAVAEGVLGQETAGAGGVLYGLRTVPVAVRLARRVRELAPRAWVINATNPAGMVTEAMATVLGHRVIGICDSPVGLVRRAARAAGLDPAAPALGYDYLGLNHLGWLRTLVHDGRDVLPDLLADSDALGSFEEGRLFGAEWLRALGAIPNEYLYYYYFRRESLEKEWEATETRGEFLDRQQSQFFARAAAEPPARAYELWQAARRERDETYLAEAREATGGWQRDAEDLDEGGYEGVALATMRAIHNDHRVRMILNVRNAGTVTALPDGAIIETVCEVGAQGAHPVACLEPGPAELGLMLLVKAAERATIEAALTGSEDAAWRALALHPLIDSPAVAARLLARAAGR